MILIAVFCRFINFRSFTYIFVQEGIKMTGFLIALLPAGLLCGGVALLIRSFVKKDTYHYDKDHLWEDAQQTSEDYRIK
jgi:hypothetical protein